MRAAWWPTGHAIGYEHPFSHQVADLLTDIAAGRQPRPSFADGLQVQFRTRYWVTLQPRKTLG